MVWAQEGYRVEPATQDVLLEQGAAEKAFQLVYTNESETTKNLHLRVISADQFQTLSRVDTNARTSYVVLPQYDVTLAPHAHVALQGTVVVDQYMPIGTTDVYIVSEEVQESSIHMVRQMTASIVRITHITENISASIEGFQSPKVAIVHPGLTHVAADNPNTFPIVLYGSARLVDPLGNTVSVAQLPPLGVRVQGHAKEPLTLPAFQKKGGVPLGAYTVFLDLTDSTGTYTSRNTITYWYIHPFIILGVCILIGVVIRRKHYGK